MAAARITLRMVQGSTFRRKWEWRHALVDEEGNVVLDPTTGQPQPGEPYDFTNATARMDVRLKLKDPDVVFTLTTEAEEIFLGGTGGLGGSTGSIELAIPAAKTNLLGLPHAGKVVTEAVYDLEVTHASGDVDRVMEGPVEVSPSVTRSDAEVPTP